MKQPVGWSELARVFGRIGVMSFGGPAAQIALMHKVLVEERGWLTEAVFLRALSLCMLLPGPEAMQLATYAGWHLRGTRGGLIAGLLFVIPGAVVIAALALVYAHHGDVPWVRAAFSGIKAAVIVIVFQALLRLSARALNGAVAWCVAAGAFVALFGIGVPYPLIILAAGVVGAVFLTPHAPAASAPIRRHHGRPVATLALWGSLWAAPVIATTLADPAFLGQIALFFSKLAVVSFGGAYALLAYMTQTVVSDYGWISTTQMIDALGLAETTPGPLILVTQFVAMLAGFEQAGAQSGTWSALVAGATALWVTFIPCFLWIFLVAPYLDVISARPRPAAALQAITAAVVGVILNLGLWFAVHVLFGQTLDVASLAAPLPVLTSLDMKALALTLFAAMWLLWLRRGMLETLGMMALAGLGISLL